MGNHLLVEISPSKGPLILSTHYGIIMKFAYILLLAHACYADIMQTGLDSDSLEKTSSYDENKCLYYGEKISTPCAINVFLLIMIEVIMVGLIFLLIGVTLLCCFNRGEFWRWLTESECPDEPMNR